MILLFACFRATFSFFSVCFYLYILLTPGAISVLQFCRWSTFFSDINLATTEHLMRFITKDLEGYGEFYICILARLGWWNLHILIGVLSPWPLRVWCVGILFLASS